jgi:sec-independent protein translocase protein TatA
MQGMEWIILLVFVVLLLFGAKKIPELAKGIGRARGEFDRGKKEVEREMREEENKIKTTSQADSTKSDSKIVSAAKDLGIETEGKSDAELKKEIQAAVQSN